MISSCLIYPWSVPQCATSSPLSAVRVPWDSFICTWPWCSSRVKHDPRESDRSIRIAVSFVKVLKLPGIYTKNKNMRLTFQLHGLCQLAFPGRTSLEMPRFARKHEDKYICKLVKTTDMAVASYITLKIHVGFVNTVSSLQFPAFVEYLVWWFGTEQLFKFDHQMWLDYCKGCWQVKIIVMVSYDF